MADVEEAKYSPSHSSSTSFNGEDLQDDGVGLLSGKYYVTRTSSKGTLRSILGYLAVIILWIASLFLAIKLSSSPCPQDGFASGFGTDLEPLKDFLEVEKVRFTGGLDFDENGTLYRTIDPGAPQYVGKPNPEIDANWDALLEVDGVDLVGQEAASIAGTTFQKPGGWWLVGIDGFHQIHCVNMLYKNMHKDYYPPKDPPDIYEVHLHHCIDYLRQSVMCNLDISPMKVEWTTKWNRLVDHFDTWHTCRNFDKVKDWMLDRSGLKHPLPKIGQHWSEPLPGPGVREGY